MRALKSAGITPAKLIEKLRVELAERNERFSVVQGAYYKVGSEIARLEQSLQHRKELIQRQGEDLASTDQQVAELNAHIASDQIELEQKSAKK